jgi:ribosomal protein S18 acetylase RimI-like enzyme
MSGGVFMITYQQASTDFLDDYDKIPMKLTVTTILKVIKLGQGLDGIQYRFEEMDVKPYIKDFTEGESVKRWLEHFKIATWAFFMANDGENPIGGAAVVANAPEICMLDGRNDLTVLWDIRVSENYKHQGIGEHLFKMAYNWSKDNGYKKMKIESQNTNIPACRFYQKQGAELVVIDENRYGTDEVMFLWYVNLCDIE